MTRSRAATPSSAPAAKDLTHARDYAAIADAYADDVKNGRVLACKWVKLACLRHQEDRKRWPGTWRTAKGPFYFD